MLVGRRLPLVVATLLVVLGIAGAVVAASAEGAQAKPGGGGESPAEDVASSLVGTWTGTKSGAEGGKFESREWRVVFRTAEANAAIGTKQYRQPNGRWSKAERVNAVVDSTGHIWASDTDGSGGRVPISEEQRALRASLDIEQFESLDGVIALACLGRARTAPTA